MEWNFANHVRPYMSGARGDDSQQGQPSTGFDFILDDPQASGWSFGPDPGQRSQEQPSGDAYRRKPTCMPHPAALVPRPSRLSLAPPNIYNRQDQEPRTVPNADNYCKIKQNLHQGFLVKQHALVPHIRPDKQIPQYTATSAPRYTTSSMAFPGQNNPIVDSPVTQLANAMLLDQPLPQARREVEPVNFWQQQQLSRINQLQPEQQQITPPFHQAFHSVESQAIARSSSPAPIQASSPTERIILRRSMNRPPPTQYQNDAPTNDGEVPYFQSSQSNRLDSTNRPMNALGLKHAPPMARGIQLVSLHELPDRMRQVFPYELFNAVQSKCFQSIYQTNDNIVVSAPTSSGKTALLELAICRLVEGHRSGEFKIVYQAPTKSLCSERLRDWERKFSHLNLCCAELTGDTNQKEMSKVRNASIIVTTPEKWDSITRKWSDHDKLMEMVKLFLIDEVHILKDTRGATLEAVVSRMKKKNPDTRFVALSATVPNSQDIAVWLGKGPSNGHIPAHRETFGEEFRPVKLQKIVHGYDTNCGNDFVFDKFLNGKLLNLIAKYSNKKPIMVFCFTRKSCENTATLLAESWARQRNQDRAWQVPLRTIAVQSKQLQELVSCGVAFHHAGLEVQDRLAIERSYLKGEISLICCTSTLAVGVNLPCHLVILKGTVGFQDGILSEYADLEVMQMLGRAGRPQFDDSAIAVIMTRKEKEDRYKKMVSGQDILESTLHLNLIEHLNSEIGLLTIHNTNTAKEWLKGTFLSVRMRQNPKHYKMEGVQEMRDADRRLELVCERDIKLLKDAKLITESEDFNCTEYGQAMSRYMVQFETMKLLIGIPPKAKTDQILHAICQAVEFKDLRIKPVERPHLREFNKSPFMKYPIKENIATTTHKINLIVQIKLGGIEYPNQKDFNAVRRQFSIESDIVFERIGRLIRCVIDCKSYDCDAVSTRHALELARSLSAGFWENSNLQLRQVTGLGPVAVQKFASSDITSVEALTRMDTANIERIMSRNPPYGRKLLDQLAGFPRLKVTAVITKHITRAKTNPKVSVLATINFQNKSTPVWNGRKPALTFMAETSDGNLTHFWRGNIMKLEKSGFEIKFMADISGPEQEITCYIACEDIVGTMRSVMVKPSLLDSTFPPVPPPPRAAKLQPQVARQDTSSSIDSDEFGWDAGDDLLLEAVDTVDPAGKKYDSDGFEDIDDFEEPAKDDGKKKAKATAGIESILMPNGKWSCNHTCSGGQLLKNGKNCKHKCCTEGLDKPRKVKAKSHVSMRIGDDIDDQGENTEIKVLIKKNTKSSQTKGSKPKIKTSATNLKVKLTKEADQTFDPDCVEVIDLAIDRTHLPYSSIVPREYQTLHALHTSSVHTDKPIRLTKRDTQPPQFSNECVYFKQTEEENLFDDGINDNDLPSPSKTFGATEGSREFEDAIEATTAPYQQQERTTSEYDDSLEDFDAGFSESCYKETLKRLTPTLVKGSLSFVDEVFDFEAYDHKKSVSPRSATISTGQQISPGSSLSPESRKRKRSPNPDSELPKRRQMPEGDGEELNITSSNAGPLSSTPSWVNEFDPELIEGLKGFVEFVD